jgi:transposase
MGFQGMEFTPEMRKMVVNVKHFFDHLKFAPTELETPASQLTASALDISESTVKVIMAAFKKKGAAGLDWSLFHQRGCRPYAIESGIEPVVRQFIRHANQTGQQVTIDIIRGFLADEFHCAVAHTTLWRTLLRWGFECGTGHRSAQLKESDRIIILRRQYLREKRANRDDRGHPIRPEIYLDESYINKNHSTDQTWYCEADGCLLGKPTGKGERIILVDAISHTGWVPQARLTFKASKKTGDYHANMNQQNFVRWFQEYLLPNIPEESVIILDNAPYHNVLIADAFPKKSHSVKRFREWLSDNAIPWTPDMLKVELFELCSRFAPQPELLIDTIAHEAGHSILRTPPYHPELQPIETCWAIVKNHVAQHNDCTMQKVWSLLEEGFGKVTNKTCQKLIQKIYAQEDAFWYEDSEKMP